MPVINMTILVRVLMVAVVMMFLYLYMDTMNQLDACLYGFWSADSEFMEEAELDRMFMYIGPPSGDSNKSIGVNGGVCSGHLYIRGKEKLNESFTAHVRRTSFKPNSPISFKLNMNSKWDKKTMPTAITAQLDPVTNMMVLSSGDKMYGRLFKKCEASYFCTATPKANIEEFSDDDDGSVYD